MQRASLRLTLACSNRCVFCGQQGLVPEGPLAVEQLSQELLRLRETTSELTFVGGEPTLHPQLAEVVALAREAGFTHVGLQTNGRAFADPSYAQTLVDAGLTDLHLSLHGSEERVHDYHVGVAGAFREVLAALGSARARRLETVVTSVLTRSSFRSLAGLPRLLKGSGVAGWTVLVPHVAGAAARSFDRVPPRLGLALPFALHAVDLARQIGLPAWIQGAPLCMLGPLAAHALPSPERAYAEGCAACPARARCPGVDPLYLKRFAGDELAPREVPPARPLPGVARLFVGPGELSLDAAPHALPAAPQVVRAQPLTQLGKVKPGAAEVSRSREKARSGEALREIFPHLFEKSGTKER